MKNLLTILTILLMANLALADSEPNLNSETLTQEQLDQISIAIGAYEITLEELKEIGE